MKLLAEALNVRASLNIKLGDLRNRIENNIYISNGNDPYEDVQELLNKALEVSNELENLVNVINQTNNNTKFELKSTKELRDDEVVQLKKLLRMNHYEEVRVVYRNDSHIILQNTHKIKTTTP
jgi:hypothetical protein